MLLVPDDRLAEVEASRLQCRWVVGDVRVAAPDVEGATGTEHPRGVAEPGEEQRLELRVADEVVDERPVLGAQLAMGGLRLLGMALEIELLVVADAALAAGDVEAAVVEALGIQRLRPALAAR